MTFLLGAFREGWGHVVCRRCGAQVDVSDAIAEFDPYDKLSGWHCLADCVAVDE